MKFSEILRALKCPVFYEEEMYFVQMQLSYEAMLYECQNRSERIVVPGEVRMRVPEEGKEIKNYSEGIALTTIESDVFVGLPCKVIDLSQATKLKFLELGAIYDCPNLEEVIFPSGMNIDSGRRFKGCFNGCPNLKRVVCGPDRVMEMKDGILYDENGTPIWVSEERERGFAAEGEALVELDDSIVSLSWDMISGQAVRRVRLPRNLQIIRRAAFQYCPNLEEISIPDTVTEIEESAFENLKQLRKVKLPNSLKKLGRDAFLNCEALESITIPSGVQIIGSGCFEGCRSLQTVDLPADLQTIGGSAFQRCVRLENVTIPNGVKSIGVCAFLGCAAIKRVEIPSGVERIENGTFSYCAALEEIVLHKDIQFIGKEAFCRCAKLQYVALPDNLNWLGENAFAHSGIRKLRIHGNIKWVETDIFQGCSEFKWMVEDGCTYLCDNIFARTAGPKQYRIPNSVEIIGSDAFFKCWGLEEVVIPENVRVIKERAFGENLNLKNVIMMNGVETIEHWAFSKCNCLREVVIPGSVRTIEKEAFVMCSRLEKVVLEEGVEELGENAFAGCGDMKEIHFPRSLKTIEGREFFDYWTPSYFDAALGEVEGELFAVKNRVQVYVPAGSWVEQYARKYMARHEIIVEQ